MINKCKVQIRMRELYNVVESLKKEGRRNVFKAEEIESSVRYPSLCFCSCNDIVHAPDRISSLRLKFFDPSSTNTYCGLCLGPGLDQQGMGQENRATTNN